MFSAGMHRKKPRRRGGSSLRLQNKALAVALESERQKNGALRDELLELQKERCQLLQNVAQLNDQLARVTKRLPRNDTPISREASKPKRLVFSLAPISETDPLTVNKTEVAPLSAHADRGRTQDNEGLSKQRLLQSEMCHSKEHEEPMHTGKSLAGVAETNCSLKDSENFDPVDSRPKRSCTTHVASYQEPALSSKLRRGDPHTDSFGNCWSPTKPARKKKTGKRKERKGLKEVTNLRVS